MALQMATNITPDVFSGVGGALFDATQGLSVSWQVNGTPYLTAYELAIYAINDTSTQLYSTGKVTLSSPFYGVLANGTIQPFTATTIDASTLSTMGITNGNEYKMYITQWWGDTDSQSVTQQSAAVIRAYSTPVVTIDAYPNPINERMYTFTATYTQAQNDGLAWVRWVLYDQSNNNAVLEDTGKIYGTSQLSFAYNALFTGTIYGLEVTVETQAGQLVSSGVQTIYISYAAAAASGDLIAMQKCGWNGVNINWSNAKNMFGTAYGEYAFADNALVLSAGNTVAWETEAGEPIAFPAAYSLVWVGQLSDGNTLSPFSYSVEDGEVGCQISGTSTSTTVSIQSGGSDIASVTVNAASIGNGATLYVLITPDQLYVTVHADDGTETSASTNLTIIQETITSLRLSGPQTCNTLWVEQDTIAGPLSAATFDPQFTKTTYFLTSFKNEDLNAGNSDTTGYSLYRLDNTTGEYRHISDLTVNQTGLIDYGAKNGHTYTYQLWYRSDTIFTRLPMSSNQITPCRWNVLLIAAQQNADGTYHPQSVYAFGCNVDLGEESNNNKSTTQDTFNGYPSVQRSSNLYRSGKLTALIGRIDPTTNQYVGDTADYADEMMALSTSNLTLFLRDRRGSFRLISIKGEIKQKTNVKWPNQAASLTIPWVEIGSAEKLSVILTNEDELWPYDEVVDTALYIDNATGHLMWNVPADYQPNVRGSVLAINSNQHMTQTFDGTEVEPADMTIDFVRMHLIADQ